MMIVTGDLFLKALALTESGNNINVSLGDHGRALGRFQVHPDWVFWASQRYHITPKLSETWDGFITRLVQGFYKDYITDGSCEYNPVNVAMRFHLGHTSYPESDDWDFDYATVFERHLNVLQLEMS